MFGTVLKNTILFVLIILILHFLINNVLVEKKILNNKEKKKENNKEKINGFDVPNEVDLERPKPERATSKNVDKMKELYDYVFDEDASNDLNKYYDVDAGAIDTNNKKDVEVKCAEELGGNKNYCNTTKPTQDELKAHYGNFNKVQCEGDIDQDKHVYIVNKFKDEKPINGGAEDESNIVGFDGFDTTFDTY